MSTRRLNAVVSLLTTLLILFHAGFHAAWMLSGHTIPKTQMATVVSWALCGAMVIHAIISIDLLISHAMESKGKGGKKYAKLNVQTVFQRISGALLIPFSALHIGGTVGPVTPPPAVHATVPVLFFAVALAHASVSTGKAFITLGIGDAKTVKVVNTVMRVICGAILVAAAIGFYLYQV